MSSMDMSTGDRDQQIPRKRTLGGFSLIAFVIAELACTALQTADSRKKKR